MSAPLHATPRLELSFNAFHHRRLRVVSGRSEIGTHFCLEANLARAETRAMMRQLVERLPDDIQLAGPVDRLHFDFVHSIKRIPLTFMPTTAAAAAAVSP